MNDNPEAGQPHEAVTSRFGERYLPAVNGTAFEQADAGAVFRKHFGPALFNEGVFYLIVGTDSGLLYRHIAAQGVPAHSRYLLIESPHVLACLDGLNNNDPCSGLAVATEAEWQEIAADMELEKYALLNRAILVRSLAVTHGHHEGYAPLWNRISKQFDKLTWHHRIALSNHIFIDCKLMNLTENQVPARCLEGAFQGKTAALLAGGPSLHDLLPWVKANRQDLLVIAVSRVSRTLLAAGIQPDVCVSIDPTDFNLLISKESLELPDDTLLANVASLAPGLLASWQGKKVFLEQRYPWTSDREPQNLNLAEIKQGTTVTNTALFLAVKMGVSQVVLGGADFCFSHQGETHAEGSMERAMGPLPLLNEQRVQTNAGKSADTTNAYQSSAITLDLQAKKAREEGCRVINPAPDAMRLEHVEHLPTSDITLVPLPRPARAIIAERLPETRGEALRKLYLEILQEVDLQLENLAAVRKLSQKALKLGKKLLDKGAREAAQHDKAVTRIESRLYGRYVNTTTFIKSYGLQRFADILRPADDKEPSPRHTSELYYQAFAETSVELMEKLREARTRILSRLEEEKADPDVLALTEQWKRDRQAGRARQWRHSHPERAKRLSEEQRRALQACDEAFEATLEVTEQAFQRRLAGFTQLHRTVHEVRDAFRSRDSASLLRLRDTLRSHRDPDQAGPYVRLIEGCLAELGGQPSEAIQHYREVPEGPARLEAAARLFALYSEAGEQIAARDMLQTLAADIPLYQPLYADMLHATGETEAAVETYTDYLLAHPDDLDSMMKLGRIFLDAGSAEGVAWTMNYILEKDPGHAAARALVESLTQPQASSE